MSTEYSTKFVKNDKPEKLNPAVGPKEVSGYSKNKEKEDAITGEPGERWMFANRTTGNSDYKERFVPYVYPKVNKIIGQNAIILLIFIILKF
jgi:hypothetical protein